MQINQDKLNRQNIGIDRLEEQNFRGILYWATGVGKTFATQLAIKRLEKIDKQTYVIAVPSAELEKQWTEKIQGFPIHLKDRIVIKTAQALLMNKLQYEVGTLIVDELHEFSSDERIKIIDGTLIKFKNFIGLTANADDKNFRPINKLFRIVDMISKEEAKEKGWIANSVEYNLSIDFTDLERQKYDKYTETIENLMPKFQKDVGLAFKVMSGGKDKFGKYWSGSHYAMALARKMGWHTNLNLSLESHKKIDDLWNPSFFISWARMLTVAVRNRKELLYNAKNKHQAVLSLVKKFNKVKTIIFSESTTFSDEVAELLNSKGHTTVVYHSKLKPTMKPGKTGKLIKFGVGRLKTEAIQRIVAGTARILSTTKALDRGLDIPDLRFAITASGTQGTTQYNQRDGRNGRKEEGLEDTDCVLNVTLYIKETQEEIWVRNRQSKSNQKQIYVDYLDDVTYTPPSNYEFTLNDL
jgi:superfamily II DNA or RNA helicase